jgi:hypothetical protein
MRRSAAPSRSQNGIKRQRVLSDNLENKNSSAVFNICQAGESTSNALCTEDIDRKVGGNKNSKASYRRGNFL